MNLNMNATLNTNSMTKINANANETLQPVIGTGHKSKVLTKAEVEELGARIEALRLEFIAKVGEEDANYIYKVRRFVRVSEVVSRSLLMFGGWIPPVWLVGTVLLGVSKIVENMELGHNVMHGQFDFMNDKSLNGNNYDWDNVCSGADWKHFHNYEHHTYTNVLGLDRDIGYTILRLTYDQKWHPLHLLNIPATFMLAMLFEWGVAIQNLRIKEMLTGEQEVMKTLKGSKLFARKVVRQVAKDYVFFPVIAGLNFLPVLAGNFVANLIRNVWAFAVIFCGHFTEDSEFFNHDIKDETRSEWYLRQIRGSANFTGGKFLHFLSGNLSHQIEHHTFPDVPANRYQEISPRLRALVEEYGIHYNTETFSNQFSQVIKRIALHSLPNSLIDRLKMMKRAKKVHETASV